MPDDQPATKPADPLEADPAEAYTGLADSALADTALAYSASPVATDDPEDTDAVDSPDAEADDLDDSDELYPAVSARARRLPIAALILGAVTVILGGFGIWATVHASSLRAQSGQQNTALTDPAATSAVRSQIDSAVQTIFSYNYANTGATSQAAQNLLTGAAITQYNSLFKLVRQQAPAEKLVVTTTVTNSGVELLTGGQARVLIFVNQQDTRAGTGQTSYGGAMLAVTAVLQDGRWKIENIDTFS
jgi:Mce-associated membrane protein